MSLMTEPPARRCFLRVHSGPSASYFRAKYSSRVDRAMLASNGERTPQSQWVTPGSKGALSRDRMSDDDSLGSDQNLLDHAPQHLLTILDGRRLGRVTQPGEEALQVLGQREVGLAVEKLCVERRQRSAQARLLHPQLGHAGAQFVQGDEVFLVGLDQSFDALGGPGEVELEPGPLGRGGIGHPELFESPVQLGLDETRVGQQRGHLTPDEVVEVVGTNRPVVADATVFVAVVVGAETPVVVELALLGACRRPVVRVATALARHEAHEQRGHLGVARREAAVVLQAAWRQTGGLLAWRDTLLSCRRAVRFTRAR